MRWYVQRRRFKGDWENIAVVEGGTRNQALYQYRHLNDFGRLRAVSFEQAYRDYEAGKAEKPISTKAGSC